MSGVPTKVNDNPLPIGPGEAVHFPNPLVNPYGTIQRVLGSKSKFVLPPSGVFEIIFTVVIQNTGELVVVLNENELLMTVVGKTGNGEVIGTSIIATPSGSSSILSINNISTANNVGLNLDGVTGGLKIDAATGALSQPLSCHLIIKQLM